MSLLIVLCAVILAAAWAGYLFGGTRLRGLVGHTGGVNAAADTAAEARLANFGRQLRRVTIGFVGLIAFLWFLGYVGSVSGGIALPSLPRPQSPDAEFKIEEAEARRGDVFYVTWNSQKGVDCEISPPIQGLSDIGCSKDGQPYRVEVCFLDPKTYTFKASAPGWGRAAEKRASIFTYYSGNPNSKPKPTLCSLLPERRRPERDEVSVSPPATGGGSAITGQTIASTAGASARPTVIGVNSDLRKATNLLESHQVGLRPGTDLALEGGLVQAGSYVREGVGVWGLTPVSAKENVTCVSRQAFVMNLDEIGRDNPNTINIAEFATGAEFHGRGALVCVRGFIMDELADAVTRQTSNSVLKGGRFGP